MKEGEREREQAREGERERTSLSNNMWEGKKNLGTDPILKWGIVKNARNSNGG